MIPETLAVPTLSVETELGPARLHVTVPEEPSALLLLGHGAGGGVDAPDLVALTALSAAGIGVLRFEQPWRTAGKRIAPAPAGLDVGWTAALATVRERWAGLPIVAGGRSAGARVACRSAAHETYAGVVALSFPLHPPGKPESSRAAELLGARCPVLVLQGANDPFGRPGEVREVVPEGRPVTVVEVPGCAHEMKPTKKSGATPESIAELICGQVLGFLP